jgi:hypothetical protein
LECTFFNNEESSSHGLPVVTFNLKFTHFINILTPVGSRARLIPFHDAIIEYFWRAVKGNLGSGAAGAGGSLTFPFSTSFLLSLPLLLANFPNSHPMIITIFIYF